MQRHKYLPLEILWQFSHTIYNDKIHWNMVWTLNNSKLATSNKISTSILNDAIRFYPRRLKKRPLSKICMTNNIIHPLASEQTFAAYRRCFPLPTLVTQKRTVARALMGGVEVCIRILYVLCILSIRRVSLEISCFWLTSRISLICEDVLFQLAEL